MNLTSLYLQINQMNVNLISSNAHTSAVLTVGTTDEWTHQTQ